MGKKYKPPRSMHGAVATDNVEVRTRSCRWRPYGSQNWALCGNVALPLPVGLLLLFTGRAPTVRCVNQAMEGFLSADADAIEDRNDDGWTPIMTVRQPKPPCLFPVAVGTPHRSAEGAT